MCCLNNTGSKVLKEDYILPIYICSIHDIDHLHFRVDSSSGESDSSASSRESISSGNSDMVIIERTMSGMYRVLDGWIKDTLPVLPDQNLQDSLLHILQEQDDVLIEGLLCLLDTHTSLYSAGRPGPDTVAK